MTHPTARPMSGETECPRCHGKGFIRQCLLDVDVANPNANGTLNATVTKVLDPECCPNCNGAGTARAFLEEK